MIENNPGNGPAEHTGSRPLNSNRWDHIPKLIYALPITFRTGKWNRQYSSSFAFPSMVASDECQARTAFTVTHLNLSTTIVGGEPTWKYASSGSLFASSPLLTLTRDIVTNTSSFEGVELTQKKNRSTVRIAFQRNRFPQTISLSSEQAVEMDLLKS